MKLTCTISHLANGKWLARHTGSSTGRVEVTAPTREEALTKMRNELQYRIEWCPCSGAATATSMHTTTPQTADRIVTIASSIGCPAIVAGRQAPPARRATVHRGTLPTMGE